MSKNRQRVSLERRIQQIFLSLLTALIFLGFWWIQDNLRAPPLPQSGQEAVLYSNQTQTDLQEVFVDAIAEAKESIMLAIYNLTDRGILHALTQKSLQGVPITVITDGRDSPYVERKLDKNIRVIKRFGPGLMHLKILIIDKEKLFLGSANMTGDSLRLNGNLVTGVQSALLAQYAAAKLAGLPEEGHGERFDFYECQCGLQKIELWFLPDTGSLAAGRVKQLIAGAAKTIQVAMFTWTRMDFAYELSKAAKRGVKVEAVIDHHSGKGVGAKVVNFLKKNGVRVRLSTGAHLLHHKCMLIDEETLVNGSANWTKAAFTTNDDCFIVVNPLTADQKKVMNQLWKVLKSDSISAK